MPKKTPKKLAVLKKTWTGAPQLIRSIGFIEEDLQSLQKDLHGIVLSKNPRGAIFKIDPDQSNEEYLDTATHETLHILFPDLSEDAIAHASCVISTILWKAGYRRIYTEFDEAPSEE